MVRVLKIFILVFASISYGQNTFTGNLSLNSQSDVDTFATQNYDAIDGNLTFAFNTNINDLSGLASLKSITGNLTFNLNPQLLSLEGLHNLTHIGQSITIFSNSNLTNIDALENITTVGGNIDIANNADLLEIEGLRNIKDVGGYLRIDANSSLQSLSGLNALDTIGVGDAPTSPGPPSSPIDNASVIIVSNSSLSDCCLLNRILNSATGVIDISNNLGGCNTITEVENSISSCALEVLYPKLDDVYVAGRTITLAFEVVPIINNQNFIYEYSIDSGATWNNAGIDNIISTSNENELQLVEWTSITSITEPTDVIIRIQSTFNGNQTIVETPVFQIHPSNYYASLGFRDDGISEMDFPFLGYYNSEDLGWFLTPGSQGHICLDHYSQDWNYLSVFECGKNILAPFSGKVISLTRDYSGNSCGNNDEEPNYGIEITVQSTTDKTFAIRFAHLKSVRDELSLGSIITQGDIIGKVGGTGLQINGVVPDVHAHVSLYKNIYEWFEMPALGTNNVYERLVQGQSLISTDPSFESLCMHLKDNHSANYTFIPTDPNLVLLAGIILSDIANYGNFVSNNYISIVGNLVLENLILNGLDRSTQTSSYNDLGSIRSVDGNLSITNTDITDLEGLQNLIYVGGDLIIQNNQNLSDFCGLRTLLENNGIQGQLIINGNLINPDVQDILSESNCSSTLSIVEFNHNNAITIFPNPINQVLEIKRKNESVSINNLKLYSISGKLIMEKKGDHANILNVSQLAKGIYFLNVKVRNSILNFKVIKQ